MKNLKKLLALLLALMMLFALCACGSDKDDKDDKKEKSSQSDKEKDDDKDDDDEDDDDTDPEDELIGSWEYDGCTLTFKKNGSGSIEEDGDEYEFDWEIKKNKLYLTIEDEETSFKYSIKKNDLTLTDEDGEEMTFSKKKTSSGTSQKEESSSTSDTSKLMGTWYWSGITMTLYADGTGTMGDSTETLSITWRVRGDVMTLTNEYDEEEVVTFECDGNILTMVDEDGEEMVWTRKSAAVDVPVEDDTDDAYYDPEMVGTWYMNEYALVLEDNGFGTLYIGDSTEMEIAWAGWDGVFALVSDDGEASGEYIILDDEMTLFYEDGSVETWIKY